MRCSAWVCRLWLAVVLWSCVVSCVKVTVRQSNSNFHTAHDTAPQDHSQPQPTHPGRTPHAVGHGLILLMMGIMMPETCWDRSLIINIELVGFISSPYVHDARSQEPETYVYHLWHSCFNCFSPSSETWHQNFFTIYSNKIGTYTTVCTNYIVTHL